MESSIQKSKPPSMPSLSLFFQGQQLHPQWVLTSYHRSIEGWRGSAAGAVACKSGAVLAPPAGVLGHLRKLENITIDVTK